MPGLPAKEDYASSINEMAAHGGAPEGVKTNLRTISQMNYDPETQFPNHRGTTIGNLPMSHPKMEALYGKQVYKHVPKRDNPEALREEISDRDRQIADLAQKVDTLTQLMAGKVAETKPVAEPLELPEFKTAPTRKEKIALAKQIDPTIKGNISNAKLDAILNPDGE